jgi:opacity protein-like surface antigen
MTPVIKFLVKIGFVIILCCGIYSEWSLCSEHYAGDFLSLGAGARALGMGNAFVAVTDGATSSYHNPAGLAHMKVTEVNLMHSEQFAGLINYNTVSFARPISKDLFMGITLLHSGVGNIKYTRLWNPSKPLGEDNRPEVASREDATDYTLYLSSARKFSDKLSVGTSVKVIRRTVGSDTAFGYGIDVGMQYKFTDHWIAGLLFKDITGTTVAWDGKASDRIASVMDAGLAYFGTMPWVGGKYCLAASMSYFGDAPDMKGIKTMKIGGEYLINDYIAVRAGSSEGTVTFGMGLMKLPLVSATSFDYAFLSDDGLDSTHRISMNIRF